MVTRLNQTMQIELINQGYMLVFITAVGSAWQVRLQPVHKSEMFLEGTNSRNLTLVLCWCCWCYCGCCYCFLNERTHMEWVSVYTKLHKWMNKRWIQSLQECMNEWINERMNQWSNECMNERIQEHEYNERTNACTNESMNEWTNDRMN